MKWIETWKIPSDEKINSMTAPEIQKEASTTKYRLVWVVFAMGWTIVLIAGAFYEKYTVSLVFLFLMIWFGVACANFVVLLQRYSKLKSVTHRRSG